LGGLGAHFLETIGLWTMTFPYMFFVWFPASFFEDFLGPGDPQNLKNHRYLHNYRQKSRVTHIWFTLVSGCLRGRFFIHLGSLWEPGQSSWTSLGHRFWRSIFQGCPGTPQGTPESQGQKFWVVKGPDRGALQPQRSRLPLPTISLKPQRSKLPLAIISLKLTIP